MLTARRVFEIALAIGLTGFLCAPALAADILPVTPAPQPAPSLPAVDGLNAKVAGFGGGADGKGFYGGTGSVSVPLGFRYGLQIDGAVTNIDTDALGHVTSAGTAAHLFWRDPSIGLLGAYGAYDHANAFNGVDVFHGGAEGALYLGRFTLESIVGAQGGNVDLGISGHVSIDTRFFDVTQVSWYPTDNFKLSAGHSYLFGRNGALLGAEWGMPTGHGTMTALFVTGNVWEGGDAAVMGGLRLYFGQGDKTLIRRHREDDPNNGVDVIGILNWALGGAGGAGGLLGGTGVLGHFSGGGGGGGGGTF